jgi:hypothetical protein
VKKSNKNKFRVEARDGETFKTVPSMPTHEVSNIGRVRRRAYLDGNNKIRKSFLLKQSRSYMNLRGVADSALSKGYYVTLRGEDGTIHRAAVASLVYEAFVGKVDQSKVRIAFRDSDPTNAKLENIYLRPRGESSVLLDKLHRLRAMVEEQ